MTTEEKRVYTLAYWRKKQDLISSWKYAHGCRDCGERDPSVLDVHHVTGVKNKKLINGAAHGRGYTLPNLSKSAIEAELMKCVPLCANCHRREHSRKLLEAA